MNEIEKKKKGMKKNTSVRKEFGLLRTDILLLAIFPRKVLVLDHMCNLVFHCNKSQSCWDETNRSKKEKNKQKKMKKQNTNR